MGIIVVLFVNRLRTGMITLIHAALFVAVHLHRHSSIVLLRSSFCNSFFVFVCPRAGSDNFLEMGARSSASRLAGEKPAKTNTASSDTVRYARMTFSATVPCGFLSATLFQLFLWLYQSSLWWHIVAGYAQQC